MKKPADSTVMKFHKNRLRTVKYSERDLGLTFIHPPNPELEEKISRAYYGSRYEEHLAYLERMEENSNK